MIGVRRMERKALSRAAGKDGRDQQPGQACVFHYFSLHGLDRRGSRNSPRPAGDRSGLGTRPTGGKPPALHEGQYHAMLGWKSLNGLDEPSRSACPELRV